MDQCKSPENIAARMDQEQRILDEMLRLLRSSPDPQEWPAPYRQIFAQAVLPVVREVPGRVPVLRREHVKGVRLMLKVYKGHRATMERLPTWIVQAARKDRRDPRWERAAERVRHNLGRLINLRSA
jgi:hypothetical protein